MGINACQVSFSFVRIIRLLMLVMGGLGLFFSFLVPHHANPWPTFLGEWIFALSVLFFLLYALIGGRFVIRGVGVFLFFLVVLTVRYLIQLYETGLGQGEYFIWLVYLVVGYIAFLVGGNLPQDKAGRVLLVSILVAGVASALIAVAQWVGLGRYFEIDQIWFFDVAPGGRVVGNIAQANNLGTLLVVSVVVLLSGMQDFWRLSRISLGVGCLILLLLTCAIALTGSRSALLGLVFVTVLALISNHRQMLPIPWGYCVSVLMVVSFLLLMPYVYGLIYPGVLPETRLVVGDANRFNLWSMGIHGVFERPWLGWGLGGQSYLYQNYALEYGPFDYKIVNQLHNVILDILVVFGVPLGGGVLLCLLLVFRIAFINSFGSERAVYVLLCVPIINHSFFEYPHYYGFFLWMLFFFVGAALLSKGDSGRGALISAANFFAIFLVGCFLVVAFKVAGAYFVIEDAVGKYSKQRYDLVKQEDLDFSSKLFPSLRLRLDVIRINMDGLVMADAHGKVLQCATYYPFPECLTMQATIEANGGQVESGRLWLLKACRMFGPETCEDKLMRFNNGRLPGWAEGLIPKAE